MDKIEIDLKLQYKNYELNVKGVYQDYNFQADQICEILGMKTRQGRIIEIKQDYQYITKQKITNKKQQEIGQINLNGAYKIIELDKSDTGQDFKKWFTEQIEKINIQYSIKQQSQQKLQKSISQLSDVAKNDIQSSECQSKIEHIKKIENDIEYNKDQCFENNQELTSTGDIKYIVEKQIILLQQLLTNQQEQQKNKSRVLEMFQQSKISYEQMLVIIDKIL